MGVSTNKIQKVRTFLTDVERLKPAEKSEVVVATASHPASTLPPVLTDYKPDPKVAQVLPKVPTLSEKKLETIPNPVLKKSLGPDELTPVNNEVLRSKDIPLSKVPAIPKDIVNPIATIANTTQSIYGEDVNVMDTNTDINEGTIITDKKRERLSLLPAMAEAIRLWFLKGKNRIEKRAKDKIAATPTVRTIEKRKEVLSQAVKQTAQAPKDDYKKLTDKLPKIIDKEAVASVSTLNVVKKNPEMKPSWQHFEGKENAKNSAISTNSQEERITSTASVPQESFKSKQEPLIKPRTVTQQKGPSLSSISGEISSPVPSVNVEPIEIVIKAEPAKASTRSWKPTPQVKNRKLSRLVFYGVSALVAVGAVWGGVSLSMWLLVQEGGLTPTNSISQSEETKNLSLIIADRETELLLTRSRDEFYNEILNNSQDSGGINIILPTINRTTGVIPASAEDLLQNLGWQASPALLRSISGMNFGTLGTTPFIVMRVTSFDTALGGLLVAEKNLSNDLAPLFGEPVSNSFDTTETGGELRPAYFEDDIVKNHDVRVLRDELDREAIVYGFVNQNTVIITTDRGAFAALSDVIR